MRTFYALLDNHTVETKSFNDIEELTSYIKSIIIYPGNIEDALGVAKQAWDSGYAKYDSETLDMPRQSSSITISEDIKSIDKVFQERVKYAREVSEFINKQLDEQATKEPNQQQKNMVGQYRALAKENLTEHEDAYRVFKSKISDA